MQRFIVILFTLSVLTFTLAESQERLFCGSCGKQNELTALFCFHCGIRIDKSALVARLKLRVSAADSLNQQVLLTPAEISVLVRKEAESSARELIRSGVTFRPRRKTEVEKTLDVVVPIVLGSAAIFFLSQTLSLTMK